MRESHFSGKGKSGMADTSLRRTSPWRDVWKRLKKNRLATVCLFIFLFFLIVILLASVIAPYDYAAQDVDSILQFPSKEHWFGTDNFGRDIFSRVLIGGKYTLAIGFGCMGFALVFALILGCAAAMVKKLDNIIMRIMDIMMSIPSFMLGLSLVTALGASLENLIIAIGICSIAPYTRVVRAAVITVKDQEYVEAARSIGANNFHILFKYILPNCLSPIIVQFTSGMVTAILTAASLSFLGQGVPAPEPEWGSMISAGRRYLLNQWYISILPGLAVIGVTLTLSIFSDGLRDALDPRLK